MSLKNELQAIAEKVMAVPRLKLALYWWIKRGVFEEFDEQWEFMPVANKHPEFVSHCLERLPNCSSDKKLLVIWSEALMQGGDLVFALFRDYISRVDFEEGLLRSYQFGIWNNEWHMAFEITKHADLSDADLVKQALALLQESDHWYLLDEIFSHRDDGSWMLVQGKTMLGCGHIWAPPSMAERFKIEFEESFPKSAS